MFRVALLIFPPVDFAQTSIGSLPCIAQKTFPFPLDLMLKLIYIHFVFTLDEICHKHFHPLFQFFVRLSSRSFTTFFVVLRSAREIYEKLSYKRFYFQCHILLKLMSMIIVDKRTFGDVSVGGLEVREEIRNLHFQELDIKISLVIWLSHLLWVCSELRANGLCIHVRLPWEHWKRLCSRAHVNTDNLNDFDYSTVFVRSRRLFTRYRHH